LLELLDLWRDQPPSVADLPLADEIFPAASYQYVYYGMGGPLSSKLPAAPQELLTRFARSAERTRALAATLPTNRAYLDRLAALGRQESAA
jgi:hypothetical protein